MVFIQEIKYGAYLINIDEYESIGTHLWIALYVNNNNATYSVRFAVQNIPNKIKKFI